MLVPKLRFKEFTNEWRIRKIEEFSSCCAGATPNTKNLKYWENGDIPWLNSGEINKRRIRYTDNFITQLGYTNSSTKILPKNTVIMALAGQGKTRGMVGITQIEVCTNQSLCGIIPNKDVDSEFLYQRLLNEYENLRFLSSGDGTRGGLNLKLIKGYSITLPQKNEQIKIGEFLVLIDKKIELQTKKIEALKLYKIGIKNVLLSNSNFERHSLSEILEKWNIRNKNNEYDYVESISNKYGFIPQEEQFSDRSVASKDKSNYYIIMNDVFAYNPSRLNVGSLALKRDNKISLISPLYECFKTNQNQYFLFEWFNSNEFKKGADSKFEGGVRNTLNFSNLCKINISLPSIDIQNKYADIFEIFNKKISSEEVKLNELISLKKGLMQNMFV